MSGGWIGSWIPPISRSNKRATAEDAAEARVVFRFGHVHMGRSARRSDGSLGHYLSQFSEDDALTSFHLNVQLINEPGHYWSLTDYAEYEPLANVGDPTKWILVDLRPARAALLAGEFTAHDKLSRLVVDFDAVLLDGWGFERTQAVVSVGPPGLPPSPRLRRAEPATNGL